MSTAKGLRGNANCSKASELVWNKRVRLSRKLQNDIQEAASAFKSAVMELETGFFERRFIKLPMEIQKLEKLCQEEEEE